MGILDGLFKPKIERLKAQGNYDALFAALKDQNLREEATRALEEMEGGPWQPHVAALTDADPQVRQAARRVFEKHKILESLGEFLQKWQKLGDAGPGGVGSIKLAAAGAVFLELVTADTIGRRMDCVDRKRHIELLIRALENPFIRGFAAEACGKTREPTTIRPLIAYGKADFINKDHALTALRQITEGDLGEDLDAWLKWAEQLGL